MKKAKISVLSVALLVYAASVVHAATFTIAYDFTGTPIENPTTTTGDAAGNSAAFTGYTGTFGFSSATDTAYVRADASPSSMDVNKYLSFTITPTVSGESLYMDSFSFTLAGSTTNYENAVNVSAVVRAGEQAADFGTYPDLVFTPGDVTAPTHTVPAFTSMSTSVLFTADLSDAAYQGLDSLTFRIYLYDDATTTLAFDRVVDMSVTGSTAIPEPATTALLVGSLAFLAIVFGKRLVRKS